MAAALLCLAGVVSWFTWGDSNKQAARDHPPAPTTAASPMPAPQQAPVAVVIPTPSPATVSPPPIAGDTAAPPAPSKPLPVAVDKAPVTTVAPTTPPPREVTSTSASTPPWLSELPDDVRRQMAAITITGAVYSENPVQRLLLVNGQVLPQGSTVVADVTLEEIRERHSVFSFRGTRFRIAH